jgi:hypothetical protein
MKRVFAAVSIIVLLIALVVGTILVIQFSNHATPMPIPLFGRSVVAIDFQHGCAQELTIVVDKMDSDAAINFYDSELQSRGWYRSSAKVTRTSLITYRKFWDVRSNDGALELFIQDRDIQTLYVQLLRC